MSQKSIWMVCNPTTPDGCDGLYLAVEFDAAYIAKLLTKDLLAGSLFSADGQFLCVAYFDGSPHWLMQLSDTADDEDDALAWDLFGSSNDVLWQELPADWSPKDDWYARQELVTVEVGREEVIYRFREKHVDEEIETPVLSVVTLRAMLARLSS